MKKRYAMLALGLAGIITHHFLPIGAMNGAVGKPNEPASDGVERAPAAEAVRQMANYLETASPRTVAALSGQRTDEGLAQPEAPVDATEAGLSRIDQTERRIASRYPHSQSGALIRRYVALSINDVHTDYQPELSRVRAMNDLMQNAYAAAVDLQFALGALGASDAESEAERGALLKLAAHVGANEVARPVIEGILLTEIGRRSGLEPGANEERLAGLVDSYTMLVADPRKQAEFVRIGIQYQEDPRAKRALEDTLESLNNRVDLVQSQ
jgi:hypothetical protein